MSMSGAHSVDLGRTRWRRVGILFLPAMLVVAVMVVLVAKGAFAVNIAISGIPFKLSATQMTGQGFVQYAQPDAVSNADLLAGSGYADAVQKGTDGKTYVADTVTVLQKAQITGLDQTICAPLLSYLPDIFPLKKYSLLVRIKAGSGDTAVDASTMVVNSPAMTADQAIFSQIQIGADLGAALGTTPNGNFAQKADAVTLKGLHQVAVNTTASSFTLPDLDLGAHFVTACP